MRAGFTRTELVVVAGVLLTLLVLCGCGGLLELPGRLLFGWVSFLGRTLPRVSVNPAGVATFAVLLAGLAAVVHSLGRWGLSGGEVGRGWGWRATAAVCGLTVGLFAAGVAATGAGHQIGWLVRSPVPLNEPWEGSMGSLVRNDLKEVGLALHNYHSTYKQFPAGGTYGPAGRAEHGWATRLLPYLDEAALAEQVRWGEPWRSPANREPFSQPLDALASPYYRLPTEDADGYALAHYAGNGRVLTDGDGLQLRDLRDGTVTTMLAGEIADGFLPWAHPANTRDPAVGLNAPGGFGAPRNGGVYVLLADGSVQWLNDHADPAAVRALATPDGGEEIEPGEW
ncbi:DUF1559 domain-containing protein [Alienimonas sp. DA493]|uniref:DUF1559 family PulG-like putative transporter n=1 Tax=Alienimonas sp. DA493 TaxID=3373605 RepID=UPI003754B949